MPAEKLEIVIQKGRLRAGGIPPRTPPSARPLKIFPKFGSNFFV
jgi:hypothetical protein